MRNNEQNSKTKMAHTGKNKSASINFGPAGDVTNSAGFGNKCEQEMNTPFNYGMINVTHLGHLIGRYRLTAYPRKSTYDLQ